MTNKEAIDRLNGMQSRCENGWDAEAIFLAIKALEEKDLREKMKKLYYQELRKEAEND